MYRPVLHGLVLFFVSVLYRFHIFLQFLNEHGGGSNAFTSGEHTNYYFDVSPDHLNGALDRYCLIHNHNW